MCYQSGPLLALVKQQLSGRIQSLQVDLDPCQPRYTGYKLAPHKTQKVQSGPTERQGQMEFLSGPKAQ